MEHKACVRLEEGHDQHGHGGLGLCDPSCPPGEHGSAGVQGGPDLRDMASDSAHCLLQAKGPELIGESLERADIPRKNINRRRVLRTARKGGMRLRIIRQKHDGVTSGEGSKRLGRSTAGAAQKTRQTREETGGGKGEQEELQRKPRNTR